MTCAESGDFGATGSDAFHGALALWGEWTLPPSTDTKRRGFELPQAARPNEKAR